MDGFKFLPALATILLLPANSPAQETQAPIDSLVRGEVIQVTVQADVHDVGRTTQSQPERLRGRFVRLTSDSLTFRLGPRPGREGRVQTLANERITRCQVKRKPNRGKGASRGALLGLGVGVLGGVLLDAAICSGGFGCDSQPALAGVVVGGVGAGIGALIGYRMPAKDWVEIPPDRLAEMASSGTN